MKKKGFLVLLFILIHLVACTKKPIEVVENTLSHENNKYVCEELRFPEEDEKESVGLKLMNYDDTLRYIKGNEAEDFIEYFAYDLNNEGSWDKIDLEWGKSKEWTKNTSLSNFSYTLQGDLYALKYTVISQNEIKKELCQLKDDGTIRIVPLKTDANQNEDGKIMEDILWFNISEDSTCFLVFGKDIETVKQYDMVTGDEINHFQIETGSGESKFSIGNEFFESDYSMKNAINVLDINTGEYLRTIECNSVYRSHKEISSIYMIKDEDENLYYYSEQGIFGGNYLDKELKQIVEPDVIHKDAKIIDNKMQGDYLKPGSGISINSFIKSNGEQSESFYVQFSVTEMNSKVDEQGGVLVTSSKPKHYLVHYYKE